MKKLRRLLKWFAAQMKRRFDTEHVVEVVVYLDGRAIEERQTTFDEEMTRHTPRYNALAFANSVTSAAVGLERRKMKGRA